jgi:hypothetical protein
MQGTVLYSIECTQACIKTLDSMLCSSSESRHRAQVKTKDYHGEIAPERIYHSRGCIQNATVGAIVGW